MSHPSGGPRLFSFEFVTLCLLVFFIYCNTTVFYSLDVYLGMLGIGQEWRGFLIGASSLSTIAFFLVLSPLMTVRRAPPCACAGAVVLMICGYCYLRAASPMEILALRLGNGLGFSLMLTSATTLFVRIIPPGLSGRAFGLYSLAGLLPFCVVPAAFDPFTRNLEQMAQGYMLMSLSLLPALVLMLTVGRRIAGKVAAREAAANQDALGTTGSPGAVQTDDRRDSVVTFRGMLQNAALPPVAMMLCMTTLYLIMFSTVFFLTKAFFQARSIANVGTFFSIQMGCIMIIRLLAMNLFDKVRKTRLIMLAFALAGAGCVLTATAGGPVQAYAAALVLGAGMGVGSPMLNSLMFSISHKRFQAVNTNLLSMFQQMGNFLGPILGVWATQLMGDAGFLAAGAAASLAAFILCAVFARKGFDQPRNVPD
ncbi:MFS transporter [Fundidesulfovibrio putealis]|uniref:MFS transporter n=1 Tax=Fundidesulfovibrio putealis TaxID=270496 RepID=UPI0003FFC79F|nr:MFS transporter [Fundidesulfovibrio putealis]